MASPLLSPLLILLLSLALGYAGQKAQNIRKIIINGASCPRGSQPWQVALFEGNMFRCAGVLIDEQWVLTVAHCYKSEYVVHMGSDLLVDQNAQKIRATESFIHPQYQEPTSAHDIMLVKLSSLSTLSPTVRKVTLPSSCEPPGTRCTLSGWGSMAINVVRYPSELQCSNVTLISYEDCKKFYPTMLRKFMICASPLDGLSYACKGDSGSPLICEGTLQGLVSSGYFPCRPPFSPIVYTNICKYGKWIYETMKTNS